VETLASLLRRRVPADARFARRVHDDPLDPADRFYLPSSSRYVRWYWRTQKGWYLTTSAQWDAYVRLVGETDLRVAVLDNGHLSRTLRFTDRESRSKLAEAIVACCAVHELEWPTDGPDLASLLDSD
jgi:hypothetical protein